jgi:hypothetical protein
MDTLFFIKRLGILAVILVFSFFWGKYIMWEQNIFQTISGMLLGFSVISIYGHARERKKLQDEVENLKTK